MVLIVSLSGDYEKLLENYKKVYRVNGEMSEDKVAENIFRKIFQDKMRVSCSV